MQGRGYEHERGQRGGQQQRAASAGLGAGAGFAKGFPGDGAGAFAKSASLTSLGALGSVSRSHSSLSKSMSTSAIVFDGQANDKQPVIEEARPLTPLTFH